MADNFIEKQYEQYEARKAAWENARKYGKKTPTATRPNTPQAPIAEQKGKRVFVTGGAEGIGKAIVTAFAQAGYHVAFCDRNNCAGKETAQATGATFFSMDVCHKEAVEHYSSNGATLT